VRKDTRLNINMMKTTGTPKSYVHELRGGETPKREVEERLGPLMVVSLGEARKLPRKDKRVADLKKEGREEVKGRVKVLVVELVKVM